VLEVVVLPLIAFILAIFLIVAIVIVAGVGFHWPGRMFHYLMLLTAITSVATIILSGRVLNFVDQSLLVSSEADISSTFSAKLLLMVVVGSGVALCAAWVFNFKNYKTAFNRFDQRGLKAPTDIIIAFMVFYIAFSIFPIFFGQRYYFHVNLIYPFFIYLALLLWAQLTTVDPAIVAKQCLGLIVFLSLAAAVVAPQLVMQPGYAGLIPGFNSRFWGVASHANTLGAVACMLLVLEFAEPSARSWLRKSIVAGAWLTLILTQSKTSILAALVGLLIIFAWRLLTGTSEPKVSRSKRGSAFPISLVAGLIISVVVVGAFAIFFDKAIPAPSDNMLDARALDNLETATGRTFIWSAAIEAGLENPLFGQGADFWEAENRRRLGLNSATSAHNLFLQAFSRSGLVGLTALLVFFYFLILYSIRAAKPTRGGSLAILGVLLMRSGFETNFQLNSVLAGEFFVMMGHFTYVIDRGAKPMRAVNRFHPFPRPSGKRT
jgi:O-antigen ligase